MALLNKKKLLVLDVNGLLLDTYFHKEKDLLPQKPPDATIGNFFVYKRPFCDEFLQFCLEKFVVGIWSSARKHNVDKLVEYLFQGAKDQLAFLWHQADCTDSGLKHPENKHKPVFLKELSKLWEKLNCPSHLEAVEYGPTNTLLVDDSPYKALRNPPHTAIFPQPYTAHDLEDSSLCGVLRKYLEGLCSAVDVQGYVKQNPFGEPSITVGSPSWNYYKDALKVDHVHCANLVVDPRSLLEIRSSSEGISGLSIEALPKEHVAAVEESTSLQVQVDMVADNGRTEMIRAPDLDGVRNTSITSKEHVSLQAFGQTDVKAFSADQNKQREEGDNSYERSEQVGQASKQYNRSSDRRIMCEDSGNYQPNKPPRLIKNSLHASNYENSRPERSRKQSRGSWGGIPNSVQKWPLHEKYARSEDGNSYDEGNRRRLYDPLLHQAQTACPEAGDEMSPHLWRKSYDRESQINRKGKRKEPDWSRSISNLAPRYDRGDRYSYAVSGAYPERFPFGPGEISHTPPLNLLSGYSDCNGRFYPSCGSDVLKDGVHVNQARVFNSMHNINYNKTFDSSDRSSDVYQNRQREFDRHIQHSGAFMEPAMDDAGCINAEPLFGTGKQLTYGANQHQPQHGSYKCVQNNVALPIPKYRSSTKFGPHPPVSGINQHSRYYLGHEDQHPVAISDHMEHRTNGSNLNRSLSGYTPSARLQRKPFEGDLSFSSRFPIENVRMAQAHNLSTFYTDSRRAPRH